MIIASDEVDTYLQLQDEEWRSKTESNWLSFIWWRTDQVPSAKQNTKRKNPCHMLLSNSMHILMTPNINKYCYKHQSLTMETTNAISHTLHCTFSLRKSLHTRIFNTSWQDVSSNVTETQCSALFFSLANNFLVTHWHGNYLKSNYCILMCFMLQPEINTVLWTSWLVGVGNLSSLLHEWQTVM